MKLYKKVLFTYAENRSMKKAAYKNNFKMLYKQVINHIQGQLNYKLHLIIQQAI
jgi:hypothetical protein